MESWSKARNEGADTKPAESCGKARNKQTTSKHKSRNARATGKCNDCGKFVILGWVVLWVV
jgi:hypothetical protein